MRKKRSSYNECFDILDSPLGPLYLVFSSDLLIGMSYQKPGEVTLRKTKKTSMVKKELSEYFEKGKAEFSCKTAFKEGTEFEKKVWNALKGVPYGETKTYKWLASKIGKPNACRAVGQALGKNPIPIIFPCHRIIESDGSIGGYSSGIDIKRRLLEMEYYTKQSKT
jgi:methylated-DNA-[protein]-cysteine S-methyltransferase